VNAQTLKLSSTRTFERSNSRYHISTAIYIADEIVVLGERRQIIVPAIMNADEADALRIFLAQGLAVADGYEPIGRTVDDVGMALHITYPAIGAQVVAQQPAVGKIVSSRSASFLKL
jgi:hypothetical protein